MTWLLAAGRGHAGAHGAHQPHLNWFDWSVRDEMPPLAFALVNFLLLVLLVKKLVWPAVRDRARGRHERIARELEEARQARARAEARLAEYERRLATIDEEIQAIVRGVREEAEAEKERVIREALAHAERLRREAAFTIEQDLKQLRIELEREVVDLATAAAEKRLRERLDEAADRRLQEEFLAAIDARAPRTTGPGQQRPS